MIIIAAGLVGWFGGRGGSPLFQAGGGHGSGKVKGLAEADSLLGETLPDHAQRDRRRARGASPLCGWSSGSCRCLQFSLAFGRANIFSRSRSSSARWRVVTFGGAYAVLAYVAQQAVEHYHWLNPARCWTGSAWRRPRRDR